MGGATTLRENAHLGQVRDMVANRNFAPSRPIMAWHATQPASGRVLRCVCPVGCLLQYVNITYAPLCPSWRPHACLLFFNLRQKTLVVVPLFLLWGVFVFMYLFGHTACPSCSLRQEVDDDWRDRPGRG